MELPSYDELPEVDGARTSWGLWGPDDNLGCLNLLTPERVQRAAALVRRGAVFPLDAALDEIDPPLFTRGALAHAVSTWPSGHAFDDHVTFLNTQASSQWDGFRHMADPERGFYNDLDPSALGIEAWARSGIAARAVVADVARFLEARGRPLALDRHATVEPDDLLATLDAQGVAVETGDVLLVHTGWLGWYRGLERTARASIGYDPGIPGLASHPGMAGALWDLHVSAVAADNPGLEALPPEGGHLHWELLPRLGIPIGELWDLGALAADCAADGVYECMLTSAPLHLRGGVASPPNALALK